MYRKLILSLVLPFCFIMLLFALIEEPTIHALNVTGPINSDTTWTVANSPYVITNVVSIEPGATLTIEAGVTVMVDGNAALWVKEGAHLEAVGTELNPILFTSVANNGAGDWTSLSVNGSARFVHTEFRNSLYNLDIIGATGGAVVLENSSIYSSTYGLHAEADALHRLQMEDVTFNSSQTQTILVHVGYISDHIALTENVTLTAQTGLDGYSIVNDGRPYSTFRIPENLTMTVEADVTLYYDDVIVEGHLQALGNVILPTNIVGSSEDATIAVYDSGSLLFDNVEMKGGDFGFNIYGSSSNLIVIKNSKIISKEKPIFIDADALHRLQMENVTFDSPYTQTIFINTGDSFPFDQRITLTENVALTAQTGLDGYFFITDYELRIPENITLTVEAGVTLYHDWVRVHGHLQTLGNVVSPTKIVGYTNFAGIYVEESGSLLFENTQLSDGDIGIGFGGNSSNSIVLRDSKVISKELPFIASPNGLHRLQMDNVIFENNTTNGVLIVIPDGDELIESVYLTDEPGMDGYFLYGCARESSPCSENTLIVPNGKTFELEAGVQLIADQDESVEINVAGSLIANGTLTKPITFMASHNDFWKGIVVDAGNVELNHTIIQDANVGIHVLSGTAQIENSQIISSTQVGMVVEGGTVTAVCTQFRNNQTTAIDVPESASPVISMTQSGFTGNGVGVRNLGDTAVSATKNWWGSQSGPQVGTDVIGDVVTVPWLLWEPECISQLPDYQIYLPIVIRP